MPARAIASHTGIKGVGSLTVATHGWSNPVARVTIARIAASQVQPMPATMPNTGARVSAPFYLLALVAAMVALGMTLIARSRRSA